MAARVAESMVSLFVDDTILHIKDSEHPPRKRLQMMTMSSKVPGIKITTIRSVAFRLERKPPG